MRLQARRRSSVIRKRRTAEPQLGVVFDFSGCADRVGCRNDYIVFMKLDRNHPVRGRAQSPASPTIVLVTVTTKNNVKWLANQGVHLHLRTVWQSATAWKVGRYLIMPDHILLFAADNASKLKVEEWVRYWKSRFSRLHGRPELRWQPGHSDTRIRTQQSAEQKWAHIRDNPVRHGLVESASDWPFQGEVFPIQF